MKGPKQPPEASEWPRRVWKRDWCNQNHPAYDPARAIEHRILWKRAYPAFDYEYFHPEKGAYE